jgi:hypothetical protein
MLKIIFAILLFLLSFVLFTILYIYYKYYNLNQRIITQKPTLSPTIPTTKYPLTTISPVSRATTKYPLTEETIKKLFPPPQNNNYNPPFSLEKYEYLLNLNLKSNIIDRFNSENPGKEINFNCYILYTNIFYLTTEPTQQGTIITAPPSGSITFNMQQQKSINEYEDEYDIIGAYFFENFYKYLSNNSPCTVKYYDYLKKITIPSDCLIEIYNYIKADDSSGYYLFTLGQMPMDLDSFVPKISKYLYYNYKNNHSTEQKYISLLNQCLQ